MAFACPALWRPTTHQGRPATCAPRVRYARGAPSALVRWRLAVPSPRPSQQRAPPEEAAYRTSNAPRKRREVINRILASQRGSLAMVVVATMLFLLALIALGRRITYPLMAHERLLLVSLAVLLPDNRHSVLRYLDAVRTLGRYRAPMADVPRPPKARAVADAIPASVRSLLPMSDIRARLGELDDYLAEVTRDHFLTRVSQDVMNLVGTDLTLRKRVVVEATAIILSLAGCFAGALIPGGACAGAVTCMAAALLPSAMSARTKHELIALIHDARVALAMCGTLAAVCVAFAPLCASYMFMMVCLGLVSLRVPQYGV